MDEVFPRAGRPGPYEGITAAGVNPRPTAVSINLSLPPVAAYATPSPLGEGGCETSAYSVTFHFPFSTYTPPLTEGAREGTAIFYRSLLYPAIIEILHLLSTAQ